MTRITFTFAKTPELERVIQSLEEAYSGLSRSEVVKLALIEYEKIAGKKNKILLTTKNNYSKLDKRLTTSIKSGKATTLKNKKDIEDFFTKL